MKIRIAFLLIVTACASSAFAQYQAPTNNGNIVVATCGTVPSDFPASGQRAPNTVDTNGNVCTTPSSAGTENVNITKVGGNSVTTTVPVSGLGTAAAPVATAVTVQGLANGVGVAVTQGTAGTSAWPVKGPAADGGASNNPFAIGVEDNGNVTNIVDTPKYQGNSQVSGSRLLPGAIYGKDQTSGYTVPVVNTNGGLGVTTIACSGTTCYSNPVALGVTTIASGSSSTIFASTTVIDEGSQCTNQTASAATVTVTDGNNAYLLFSFSIPANSVFSFRDYVGTIMASGIKASAGTGSAIVCRFRGKQ